MAEKPRRKTFIPDLGKSDSARLWREFSDDLATISDSAARALGRMISDLVDGFPDPLAMFDAVLKFQTGLVAIVVEAPVRRYWRTARANVDAAAHSKLMTPVDAVQWVEDQLVDTGSMFLGISPNDLVGWLLERAAIWLYQTFKRVKFLLALVKIRNEADAVRLVASIIQGKLKLVRFKLIFAAIALVFYLVARISGLVMAYRAGPSVLAYCLPQTSKRTRKPGSRGTQYRLEPGEPKKSRGKTGSLRSQ